MLKDLAVFDKNIIEIMIGVTRKCNLKCAHCLRGEDERVSLEVEQFNKLLLKNPDLKYISELSFTGGEPFMNPSVIQEIVSTCRHRGIAIERFFISTNGTVWNTDVIKALDYLYSYVLDKESSTIRISNSSYHKKELDRLNLLRYTSIEEVAMDLYEHDWDWDFDRNLLELDMFLEEDTYTETALINLGRATDLKAERVAPMDSEVSDEVDKLFIYLTETGKIYKDFCNVDYESADKIGIDVEDYSFEVHYNELEELIE